jgi:hypothetical protein
MRTGFLAPQVSQQCRNILCVSFLFINVHKSNKTPTKCTICLIFTVEVTCCYMFRPHGVIIWQTIAHTYNRYETVKMNVCTLSCSCFMYNQLSPWRRPGGAETCESVWSQQWILTHIVHLVCVLLLLSAEILSDGDNKGGSPTFNHKAR